MNESLSKLFGAALRLVRELPPETLEAMVRDLERQNGGSIGERWRAYGGTPIGRMRIGEVIEASGKLRNFDLPSFASSLRAMAYAATAMMGEQRLEIAWTGPSTEEIPVRRVDQIMYQLLEGASAKVLLTTFVTWGAGLLVDHLQRATDRGVIVTIVAEDANETNGKLEFDGLSRLRGLLPKARIFYWPAERRPNGARGRRGIFHAKSLICDSYFALISSANLTDHGLESNMELGLLVQGGEVPARLERHFDQLIERRELVRWTQ